LIAATTDCSDAFFGVSDLVLPSLSTTSKLPPARTGEPMASVVDETVALVKVWASAAASWSTRKVSEPADEPGRAVTTAASELEVAFIVPHVSESFSAFAAVAMLDIRLLMLWYAVTTLVAVVILVLSAAWGAASIFMSWAMVSVVLMPVTRPSTLAMGCSLRRCD
jgi:hypothetical protein